MRSWFGFGLELRELQSAVAYRVHTVDAMAGNASTESVSMASEGDERSEGSNSTSNAGSTGVSRINDASDKIVSDSERSSGQIPRQQQNRLREQQQHQQPEVNGVSSDGSHLFVFTNEKAGMKSVNKERANRIIYEMSKNSSYFRHAELQDHKVDGKVADMKEKLKALDANRIAQLTTQADRIAAELEAQRELDNVCMVVDMDMFFAAVEIRDRPELATKPVAVGGEGMISTTNYHARLKGVRSGMPGFIGKKLCPELIFVKPDFQKYTIVAEKIRAIFREYDPRMRSHSLDEAYLNVTQVLANRLEESEMARPVTTTVSGSSDNPTMSAGRHREGFIDLHRGTSLLAGRERLPFRDKGRDRRSGGASVMMDLGGIQEQVDEDEDDVDEREDTDEAGREEGMRVGRTAREERRARMFEAARSLAEEIRRRITEATQLTASIGIGPNFMLAKVASDWNKPNGQMCIGGDRAEVLRFLHDLPVRKIGGVGKVTEKCLREAMGVVTCGDLFRERAKCVHLMTPHTSRWLVKISLGIGSSDHDASTEQAEAAGAITRKQISKERTFGELFRPQDLLAKCREICDSLAREMSKKGLEAKTIGLKVKTTKFQVRTQDSTGQTYISTADELYATVSSLLNREIRTAAASAPGGKLRLRLMGVRASGFRGQAGSPLLPGQSTLRGFLVDSKANASLDETIPSQINGSGTGAESSQTGRAGGELSDIAGGFTKGPEQEDEEQRAGVAVAESGERERDMVGLVERPLKVDPVVGFHGSGGSRGDSRFASEDRHPSGQLPVPVEALSSESSEAATTAAAVAVSVEDVVCPVCGVSLGGASNAAVNRHVDGCLGVDSISEENNDDDGVETAEASGRGGGDRSRPRRPKDLPARKRAKGSPAAASIEKFLMPTGRT